MALMLDDMRAEFARKLSEDPAARFSMDKALAHVITLSYQAGMRDAGNQCMVGDYEYKSGRECRDEILAKLGAVETAA